MEWKKKFAVVYFHEDSSHYLSSLINQVRLTFRRPGFETVTHVEVCHLGFAVTNMVKYRQTLKPRLQLGQNLSWSIKRYCNGTIYCHTKEDNSSAGTMRKKCSRCKTDSLEAGPLKEGSCRLNILLKWFQVRQSKGGGQCLMKCVRCNAIFR